MWKNKFIMDRIGMKFENFFLWIANDVSYKRVNMKQDSAERVISVDRFQDYRRKM